MKRCMLVLMVCFLFQTGVSGQEAAPALSLEQAIETALANNIYVRQSTLRMTSAKIDDRQAKANLLPSVNASVVHGINLGRSIDPFTNSYVDQEIKFGSYGAGASLLLFNGLNQQHTMRQQGFAYDTSKLELQQARDNLSLSIMLAYLQATKNCWRWPTSRCWLQRSSWRVCRP